MAEDIPSQMGSFQPVLEDTQPLFIFGKKGNRYALHGRGRTPVCNLNMLWTDWEWAK
jgi:hypothetical protein